MGRDGITQKVSFSPIFLWIINIILLKFIPDLNLESSQEKSASSKEKGILLGKDILLHASQKRLQAFS